MYVCVLTINQHTQRHNTLIKLISFTTFFGINVSGFKRLYPECGELIGFINVLCLCVCSLVSYQCMTSISHLTKAYICMYIVFFYGCPQLILFI